MLLSVILSGCLGINRQKITVDTEREEKKTGASVHKNQTTAFQAGADLCECWDRAEIRTSLWWIEF